MRHSAAIRPAAAPEAVPRQLTVRAVLAGMAIGALMCLSNLYVVLKTGWSLTVTVTAAIVGYAGFAGARRLGLSRSELGLYENTTLCTVASAAGYMTGGGNMAAMCALLVLVGMRPDPVWAMVWFAAIAALGVFVAIPLKRQLIDEERLPFPTGIAAAEALRSLHNAGDRSQGRFLGGAAVIGAAVAFLRDARTALVPWSLPTQWRLPFAIHGVAAEAWTLSVDGSLLLAGAGSLMSFRMGWSLLLGAVVTYGVLAPAMVDRGVIAEVSYRTIVQWTLWPGAGMLIASALLSFLLGWRALVRSLLGMAGLVRRAPGDEESLLRNEECPATWFPLGLVVLGPLVLYLMWRVFHVPVGAGAYALPLGLVLAVVAARVTGETNTTPTKALGAITHVSYGSLLPGDLTANVVGPNVTGGMGLHAADMLTDLRAGSILGASPRKQLIAQLFGVVAGAVMVVPAFNLIVPSAAVIGSERVPAPGALVWISVARVMAQGWSSIPPGARLAGSIGASIGIVLVLLERLLPARLARWVPSPSGIGVAMVIPGYNALSMFLGSMGAILFRRARPKLAARALLPISSGLIAGESLMGILIAILVSLGWMASR